MAHEVTTSTPEYQIRVSEKVKRDWQDQKRRARHAALITATAESVSQAAARAAEFLAHATTALAVRGVELGPHRDLGHPLMAGRSSVSAELVPTTVNSQHSLEKSLG